MSIRQIRQVCVCVLFNSFAVLLFCHCAPIRGYDCLTISYSLIGSGRTKGPMNTHNTVSFVFKVVLKALSSSDGCGEDTSV